MYAFILHEDHERWTNQWATYKHYGSYGSSQTHEGLTDALGPHWVVTVFRTQIPMWPNLLFLLIILGHIGERIAWRENRRILLFLNRVHARQWRASRFALFGCSLGAALLCTSAVTPLRTSLVVALLRTSSSISALNKGYNTLNRLAGKPQNSPTTCIPSSRRTLLVFVIIISLLLFDSTLI